MSKPAARVGDMTAHCGVIMVGNPTVLIGGMPAARSGDMHLCPLFTPGLPPIPHVGGPIMMGSPMVLIGGTPAARIGDMAMCIGPPDAIAMGCPTVLIGEGGSGGAGGAGGGAGSLSVGGAAFAMYSAISSIVNHGHFNVEEESGALVKTASSQRHRSSTVGNSNSLQNIAAKNRRNDDFHWIEYRFVDSAGNPLSGIPYHFTDVNNNVEKDVIPYDGRILRGGFEKSGKCKINLFSIADVKWSKNKARVGEEVLLSAKVQGFKDGTKAVFEIWEEDLSGADDFIKRLETTVNGGGVKTRWTYEYMEDVDDITEKDIKTGYSSPEYYFRLKIGDIKARSDLLEFEDSIEIVLKDEDGNPLGGEEYIIYLSDGKTIKGKLDNNGYTRLENIKPGKYYVKFPNI